MQEWILSANSRYFNHKEAFERFGFIDWKQTRNYAVGDVVYIYSSRPESKIKYKTVITDINMTKLQTEDFSDFCLTQTDVASGNRFFRIKLLREFKNELLGMSYLQEHGMRYAPQSPCKLSEELAAYIYEVEENNE